MQNIPGFHDKSRVEIFCYSLSSDDNTSFRRKIQEEVEHFVDLSLVILLFPFPFDLIPIPFLVVLSLDRLTLSTQTTLLDF